MNKGLFLCGLFIALFLAGCGDDEVKIANQMTLYSRRIRFIWGVT